MQTDGRTNGQTDMTKIIALFGILRTGLNTVHSRNHEKYKYRVQVNSEFLNVTFLGTCLYHWYMSVPVCLKHVGAAASVIL
jgi:gentisate 1,2-dioxygenase